MAITLVDLTGNVADILATTFDPRRTKVWVETNVEGNMLTDTDTAQVRLGTASTTIDTDGSFTLTDLIATNSASVEPSGFQYRLHVDYADTASKQRTRQNFGWFSLASTADLSTVVEEQYVPPTYMTTAVGILDGYYDTAVDTLQGYVDAAEAARDEAVDISNISTTDALVATNVGTGPLTGAALEGFLATKYVPISLATGTNQYTALQAILTSASAGDSVYLPEGTFDHSTGLSVPAGVTLYGPGKLRYAGTASAAVTLNDGSKLRQITIQGPGSTSLSAGSTGVYAAGAQGAPLLNIEVSNVEVYGFRQYGINMSYVQQFVIADNYVHDNWYGLILLLSPRYGSIRGNTVDTATIGVSAGIGTTNQSYGIALTWASSSDDRPQDCEIVGNIVRNVTGWEGIDTHAGQRILIERNFVYGCRVGIAVVGAFTNYAPLDVKVRGNVVDSLNTTGAVEAGISFAGAGSVTGTPIELATGEITGNTVRRHGDQNNGSMGALYLVYTRGLKVAHNDVDLPGRLGINWFHDNYDGICASNTVSEVWTLAGALTGAFCLRSGYNTVSFSGNKTIATGEKASGYTIKNDRGLYTATLTSTLIGLGGGNDFSVSTAPYSGGQSVFRQSAFDAAAVARASAYTQTYATTARVHSALTSTAVATTTSTQTTPWGFSTQAQANDLVTQVNALRTDLTVAKNLINSLIDDLQAYGISQ